MFVDKLGQPRLANAYLAFVWSWSRRQCQKQFALPASSRLAFLLTCFIFNSTFCPQCCCRCCRPNSGAASWQEGKSNWTPPKPLTWPMDVFSPTALPFLRTFLVSVWQLNRLLTYLTDRTPNHLITWGKRKGCLVGARQYHPTGTMSDTFTSTLFRGLTCILAERN